MKTCTKCKIRKQNCYFHKNANMADGRLKICKACKSGLQASALFTKLNVGVLLRNWKPVR